MIIELLSIVAILAIVRLVLGVISSKLPNRSTSILAILFCGVLGAGTPFILMQEGLLSQSATNIVVAGIGALYLCLVTARNIERHRKAS